MGIPGIFRGYRVGKELIELCSDMRRNGIDRLVEMNSHPEYKKRFIDITRKVRAINNNGSLCTRLGMAYLSKSLNSDDYFNGIFYYTMSVGKTRSFF